MSAEDHRWFWWLIGIFGAAVLLRIPPLFAATLWYDDAVEGLMSLDVLRGRFPIFFYGQPVHGAADRYIAALIILVFGPTTIALKLAALLLFFVLLGSIASTTRQIFGAPVAAVATLLVAVPPYYLFGWSYDARGHYPLMLILGVWSLFLAWRILQEGVWQSPGRRFAGLGLLAGLSWWTNYLSLSFLAPISAALLIQGIRVVRRSWRPLFARGLITLVGFLCGVLPILAYYLRHRVPLIPPGSAAAQEEIRSHLESMTTRALPQILGVHPEIWHSAYGLVYGIVVALTLGALLYAAGWWVVARRAGSSGGTVGLLLGVVAMTLLLSLLTQYGSILRYPRYLLPLYLAMPVFFGLAAHHLGQWSPALKWLAVAAITLNNLLGSLATTPVLASPDTMARQESWSKTIEEQVNFLDRQRLHYVYGGSNIWSFLSGRRIFASDPYQERMTEVAQAVDASERIGWVFREPSRPFEQSASAAGIRYRMLKGPGFVVYADFDLRPTGYAEIDPAGWSATASDSGGEAAAAYDRELHTLWRLKGRLDEASFYQLDLARRHTVGMLTWLPGHFREIPSGFRVALSVDGQTWREVVSIPEYFGPLYWSGLHPFQRVRRSRVEIRFPPTDARLIRIEAVFANSRSEWSIRELFAGTPVTECPRKYDTLALVKFLLRARVRFAHADHWLSANIGTASAGRIGVLPSNKSVNSYGLSRPEPDAVESLRLKGQTAIVVDDCPSQSSDSIEALLRESGVSFSRHSIAGFVVFADLQALPYTGVPVTWQLLNPPGTALVTTMDEPRRADYVVVHCDTPMGSPIPQHHLRLETSVDERTFVQTPFRLIQQSKLRISGSRLFRDAASTIVLKISPQPLVSVRITKRTGTWEWCLIRDVLIGPGD